MAAIVDIAAAVVAELNGSEGPKFGTPPAGLNAERAYRPTFDLADMKDLHVTVVPRGVELQGASRSMVQADVQIDIGVQRKLAAADNAEIDALMALAEQIGDFFRTHRLAGAPDASWVRTENVPIYSPEHLDQLRQFTSVLTVTFRVLR